MRSIKKILSLVFCAAILYSQGIESAQPTLDDYLIAGDRAYAGKHWDSAIAHFYNAYKISELGSVQRETAQYYMAKAFMNLGYTYAASEFFYEIVKSGSNIDRITDSLYIIQELIENYPHDEYLIEGDLIFNMEYTFVPGDLLDFANYYKGEVNFKKKLYKWANMRFSLISKDSYYFNKLKFLKGIQILALRRVEKAIEIFKAIIDDKFQDFNIKNKARQTVARLLYEQKKYPEAYELYTKIDSSPLEQDSVFLEKAWTLYFMKRYQDALGALNALWSPRAKKRFFYPEKFVLKALIFRKLCQYEAAKSVVVDFQNHYGEAIETILNRDDPFTSRTLTNAAMWNTEIRGKTQFIDVLKREKDMASSQSGKWKSIGLEDFLIKIYDMKIDEYQKLIDNDLLDRFKEVSNQLLDYYEQMRIVEYELSLDELSRLKKPPLDVEKVEPIPLFYKGKIYWPFDGEYWTDELLLYKHLIKNRCGQSS